MARGPEWYMAEADKLEKLVEPHIDLPFPDGTVIADLGPKYHPGPVVDEVIRRYKEVGWSTVTYEEGKYGSYLTLKK